MSLFRTIRVCYPDIHPKPKTTVLAFGDRLDVTRHFPCAWNCFSFEVFTARAAISVGLSGVLVFGDGLKRVPFWWALSSRWKSVTIHAGFIGLASWRHCPEMRARAVRSLEAARIKEAKA